MTTLVFEDRGQVVATSAWTATMKSPGRTVLSYLWGATVSTGVSGVELPIDLGAFLTLIAGGGQVLDLRPTVAAASQRG